MAGCRFQAMKTATTARLTPKVIATLTVRDVGTISRGNDSFRSDRLALDDRIHAKARRLDEEV